MPHILRKMSSPRDGGYANAFQVRAEAAFDRGDFRAAKVFGDTALMWTEKMDRRYMEMLHMHALSLVKLGQYKEAEAELEEVQSAKRAFFGEHSRESANVSNDLAVLYGFMDNYEKANAAYEHALEAYAILYGKEDAKYVQVLHNMGSLALRMHDYEQAERLLWEAMGKRLRLFGKNSLEYASSLNAIAVWLERHDRFFEAEALYKEALLLRRQIFGEAHLSYINTLNNLGVLYKEMHRYSEGEGLLLRALEGYGLQLGEEHPDYLTALYNLALLYVSAGRYAAAEERFLQVQQIIEKIFTVSSREYLRACVDIAELYERQGQYARAIALLKKIEYTVRAIYLPQHEKYQQMWLLLMRLHYKIGDKEQARSYAQRLLLALEGTELIMPIEEDWKATIRENKWSNYKPISMLLLALEVLFEHDADREEKIILSEIAIELLQKGQGYFHTEADRLSAFRMSAKWLGRALPIFYESGLALRAFELSQTHKYALVLQGLRRSGVRRFGDIPDSLARREDQLIAQVEQLKAQLGEQRSERERDSLLQVHNDYEQQHVQLQQQIRRDYPRYAQLQDRPIFASPEELRALLPANTALIEYVLTDSSVYVFYLDEETFLMQPLAPTAAQTNAVADSLHAVLSDFTALLHSPDSAFALYSRHAHWCYAQLLEPLMRNRPNVERLLIIPDGHLHRLPFEAFLTQALPQNGETPSYNALPYLLHQYIISYSPSSTLWQTNTQASIDQMKGRVLAMAAHYSPAVALPSDSFQLRYSKDEIREQLPPLPAARQEVENLRQLFDGAGIFLFDSSANEAAFKRYAPHCDIIHLSMHGLSNETTPLLSTLVMSDSVNNNEDNFLHAYEISRLRLRTQLVVLSACQTGSGKYEKTNGVASLARSFAYAGVPSMLVSLWAVNDQTTAQLMSLYYEQLYAQEDKASAITLAKRQYLRTAKGIAAHPAFWSAFLQIGDTRPLHLPNSRSYTWWLIAGGTTLVAAVGYRKARRRRLAKK